VGHGQGSRRIGPEGLGTDIKTSIRQPCLDVRGGR
jgi:hypothetical protein